MLTLHDAILVWCQLLLQAVVMAIASLKLTMHHCVCLLAWLALAPLVWAGPDELKNAWPDEWEQEFQARAERVLKGMCAKEKAGGLAVAPTSRARNGHTAT